MLIVVFKKFTMEYRRRKKRGGEEEGGVRCTSGEVIMTEAKFLVLGGK